MARKSTPQPLTLPGPTIGNDAHELIDSPNTRSPLSPKSPRSPRSPFKFTSSKKGEEPSMQPPETQTPRATLPSSQTTPSLSTTQQSSVASAGHDKQDQDRPVRSGFFSNYKASKSSSRLQNSDTVRQVPEDSMSRDTDRPTAMSGKVSSQETAKAGTTIFVSPAACL
jgi:hypothetical protein